jgi:hypothetical protein
MSKVQKLIQQHEAALKQLNVTQVQLSNLSKKPKPSQKKKHEKRNQLVGPGPQDRFMRSNGQNSQYSGMKSQDDIDGQAMLHRWTAGLIPKAGPHDGEIGYVKTKLADAKQRKDAAAGFKPSPPRMATKPPMLQHHGQTEGSLQRPHKNQNYPDQWPHKAEHRPVQTDRNAKGKPHGPAAHHGAAEDFERTKFAGQVAKPDRNFSEQKAEFAEIKLPGEQVLRAAPVNYFAKIAKPRQGKARSSGNGNALTFSSKERLFAQGINAGYNTAGSLLVELKGNPSVLQAPKAKWAAQAYDNYEFTEFRVMWSASLGTTATGRIGAAFDVDTTDVPGGGEAGVTRMASHPGYDSTHMFIDKAWHMPASCKRACWTKYDTSDDSDERMTDQFNFFALVAVPLTGPTIPAATAQPLVIGEWYIEYKIRFFNQTLENVILGDAVVEYNTTTSGVPSTNIVEVTATNRSAFSFLSYPTVQTNPAAAFAAAEDCRITGPLSSDIAFTYLAALGLSATVPVAGGDGFQVSSPSIPLRMQLTLDVTPTWVTALTYTVWIFNVDVPAQNVSFTISAAGPGMASATYAGVRSGAIVNPYSGSYWGIMNCPATALGTITSAAATQIMADILVDPSAWNTNPSRLGYAVTVAGTTLSAHDWTTATSSYVWKFSALSDEQQLQSGMPHYTQQGAPLQARRRVTGSQNLDIARKRAGHEIKTEQKSLAPVDGLGLDPDRVYSADRSRSVARMQLSEIVASKTTQDELRTEAADKLEPRGSAREHNVSRDSKAALGEAHELKDEARKQGRVAGEGAGGLDPEIERLFDLAKRRSDPSGQARLRSIAEALDRIV